MTPDRVERWVRRCGAGPALFFVVAVFWGLWKSSRRPIGRVSGRMPAFLRHSFWVALVAGFLFFPLMVALWKPLPLRLSTGARRLALFMGALAYFPGLALMIWGRLALGDMYGVSSGLGAQLYTGHRLITSGPYSIVRHPMYLGAQFAGLGSVLLYRTWATLFLAAILPVMVVRARREEDALKAEFGKRWEAYACSVPAWIPRLKGNRISTRPL